MNHLLLALAVLHPDLLPKNAPPTVRCLSPGLSLPEETAARYWQAERYPLSPKEAKLALQELVSYALEQTGQVREQAYLQQKYEPRGMLSSEEEASLRVLERGIDAQTQQLINMKKLEQADAEQVRKAQLTLLLAWNMEKEFLEISAIAARLQQSPLAAAHSSPVEADDFAEDVQELANLESHNAQLSIAALCNSSPRPDWRVSLYAMTRFLPENGILFGWQPELEDQLPNMRPLTKEQADMFTPNWPAAESALYGAFPLWQILKLSNPEKMAKQNPTLSRLIPLIYLPNTNDFTKE